jgi:ribosomal protein S18 acetylase RimI-like enzyme
VDDRAHQAPVTGERVPSPESGVVIRELESGLVDRVGAALGLARLHEGGAYFVAWYGDEPVGHAHLSTDDPPALQDVEVAPRFRRRGVATALTGHVESVAGARGCTSIRLEVASTNDPAQALYRKCGYRDAGLPPRRVNQRVVIRTGPIDVDATYFTWEKPLATPRS